MKNRSRILRALDGLAPGSARFWGQVSGSVESSHKRRDALAETFVFGLKPIINVAAVCLTARFVQFVGAHAYFPPNDLDQESSNVFRNYGHVSSVAQVRSRER